MIKNRIFYVATMVGLFLVPMIYLTTPSIVFAVEKVDVQPMDLNNTEWDVEMISINAKGEKNSSSDKLTFQDNQFVSTSWEVNGYEQTNYSLTLQEDGSTRFGTMQLKGEETSFWKGVVKGDKIDGSVHTQFSNGLNKTTYFTGSLISGNLKPKVKTKPKFPKPDPVVVPVVPIVPDTPVAPPADAVKENDGVVKNAGSANQIPVAGEVAAEVIEVVEDITSD